MVANRKLTCSSVPQLPPTSFSAGQQRHGDQVETNAGEGDGLEGNIARYPRAAHPVFAGGKQEQQHQQRAHSATDVVEIDRGRRQQESQRVEVQIIEEQTGQADGEQTNAGKLATA